MNKSFLISIIFLLFLTSCITIERDPKSKVIIERKVLNDLDIVPEVIEEEIDLSLPAQNHLELIDNSELVGRTVQMDITIKNPIEKEIILTRVCTEMYDYFEKPIKKDVWFTVTLLQPKSETHIKRDIYTETTQSKGLRSYKIWLCGAEYGEGFNS